MFDQVYDLLDEVSMLSTCTSFTTYEYKKEDLHSMVWLSLWSWLLPYVFYRVLDAEAYFSYFGYDKESNPISELWAPVTTEHQTL